jgi:glycosyltransferase involved in cell wall biosynthesis
MIEDLPHGQTLALMGAAAAFVLPSRIESFAIVLLEAGALGTPVIATEICGVGELIEDGVHGALVPPEDPEALAAKILDLHRTPDRLRALGEGLRDHVARDFRWSTAARRYVELATEPVRH